MTPLNIDISAVLDFAALIGAAGGIAAALYIARNKGIIANYKETVEAQDKRLSAQDGLLEQQAKEMESMKGRLAKMEGERDGYRFAVNAFVEAVATSGVCTVPDCPTRVLPSVMERRHQPRGKE